MKAMLTDEEFEWIKECFQNEEKCYPMVDDHLGSHSGGYSEDDLMDEKDLDDMLMNVTDILLNDTILENFRRKFRDDVDFEALKTKFYEIPFYGQLQEKVEKWREYVEMAHEKLNEIEREWFANCMEHREFCLDIYDEYKDEFQEDLDELLINVTDILFNDTIIENFKKVFKDSNVDFYSLRGKFE